MTITDIWHTLAILLLAAAGIFQGYALRNHWKAIQLLNEAIGHHNKALSHHNETFRSMGL